MTRESQQWYHRTLMPEAHVPKISAILVAYNRAAFLPQTLDSLLAQSLGDFELIVSDDCSSDGTREVCMDYARRDPRIRYRCNPVNLRMPGNLNAALAEAVGEYVAILHDGDIYRADLFERWSDALDRHPDAAFVFNAYERMDGQGRWGVSDAEMPECLPGHEFLKQVFLRRLGGSPVYGTPMLRRACLEAAGPFDARYSMHSDLEMWVRLASRWSVAYVGEPLIKLMPRERGHFLTRHYWWERTVDIRVKRLAFAAVYPKWTLARLWFELRARVYYAKCILAPLYHRRWSEVITGLYVVATGRDEVARPY